MHQFYHNFNIFKELLLSCTSGWPKDTELIVQCSLRNFSFSIHFKSQLLKMAATIMTVEFGTIHHNSSLEEIAEACLCSSLDIQKLTQHYVNCDILV